MKYEKDVKKYMMVYDHHTHTTYSHGTGSIEDNVRAAHEKGLAEIAITDHGPGHLNYGIDLKKLPEMRAEIERLKKVYPDVNVLLGVEANTFRSEPYIDVPDKKDFDILLAGYHFGIRDAGMVPNWLSKHIIKTSSKDLLVKNTDMILNALYYSEEHGNHIDILTHPGDKGPFDIEDIARACEDTGTFMEINLKHPYLSIEGLNIAKKYDVKFVISSDAHIPENVGIFEPQLIRAFEAGIDPERIVNIKPVLE